MKRWLILVGRAGTVLLVVGLALLLVSAIPPAKTDGMSSGTTLSHRTIVVFGSYTPPFANSSANLDQPFSNLTPQKELKIDITCNGTLEVYLLKVNAQEYSDSLIEDDISALNQYLQSHPGIVAWQGQVEQSKTVNYIPTEVVNASIVVVNLSQDSIMVSYEGSIMSLLGPASKAQTIALFMLPTGLVLTLPLVSALRKTRAKKSISKLRSNGKDQN